MLKPILGATKGIGVDIGIETFLRDSNDRTVDNPKFFRESEKLLRRRQRSLSRKAKGSSNRDRARILVAKTHEKVANQRKHFLHRVANHYVKRFKAIYVEDLNIEGMVQNRYLAKSISDCSWGMFFNICSCKVEETDKRVIKVPPKNTTQVCSSCGFKVHKSLAQCIHRCPNCNLKIHRDFNSALNILAVGQTVQAQTSAMAGVA